MVDCGGLENRCPFTRTGGSNPSASALLSFALLHATPDQTLGLRLAPVKELPAVLVTELTGHQDALIQLITYNEHNGIDVKPYHKHNQRAK